MQSPLPWLAAALAVVLVAAFGACRPSDALELCGPIPARGCPIGRGGSCLDQACGGLYDCVSGRWRLVTACTPGAADLDGGPDGDAACTPIVLDLDAAVPASNCTPDLEAPDCPAGAAETCAEDACLTGCTDFYICEAEGWRSVAFCDDQGHLIRP